MDPSTPTRRLSIRRGSVSASDPYGAHSELNFSPARSISSKLTIVRVNDPQITHDQDAAQQSQRPSSPLSFQNRRHKRHGSNSSVGSTGSESGRLSFAFSTFGPANPNGRSASPTANRQQRPGSPSGPSLSRHRGGSFSKPKLAPEQVLELARTSTNPRPSPHSPLPTSTSSPSFTPLPDNVYLPFIDRPSEVSTLISTAPTAKLFALLSQTFPHSDRQSRNTVTSPDFIDSDPKLWNFDQLEYWIKSIDRDLATDEHWIRKSRACILSHSELIWERIKGAFGVPPELDMSEDEDEPLSVEDIEDNLLSSSESQFSVAVDEGSPALDNPDHSPINHMLSVPLADMPPSSPSISIEPVFASDPNTSSPHDLASGLGDITEEESEANEETVVTSPASPRADDMVHGLRICTSPSPPHPHTFSNPVPLSAISPIPSPPASSSGIRDGIIPEGAGLQRRNSSSSSLFVESPLASSISSYFAYAGPGDDPYHFGAERGPGHPIFPSSFAHLAMGPTLRANNPSLRRLAHPPPSAFPSPHGDVIRARKGPPSWIGTNWDGRLSDCAVTSASDSSVAGEA